MEFHLETEDSGRAPFRWLHLGRAQGSGAFLLRVPGCNLLWDTGYGWYGRRLAEELRSALEGEAPDCILLSHSHYDHAGGAPYIKERWPEARVVAGEHAAAVFAKASARQKMRELDDFVARERGYEPCDERFDTLRAEVCVGDGDRLPLGERQALILAFPGHTRDSLGCYFPEERFLLSSETLGVPTGGDHVSLAMLVGYRATAASLEKALELDLDAMLLPHHGLLYGADCRAFLRQGLYWAEEIRQTVLRGVREGWEEAELTERVGELIWGNQAPDASRRRALQVNAALSVRAILREEGA